MERGVIRTVPPFASVHTLYTSLDGLRSSYFLRTVRASTNSKTFCTVYDHAGKENIGNGYRHPPKQSRLCFLEKISTQMILLQNYSVFTENIG